MTNTTRATSFILSIVAIYFTALALAQQPTTKQAPAPVAAQPAAKPAPTVAAQPPSGAPNPAPGRVLTVSSAKLPRFASAVTKPSHTKPPDRDGGHWRWHQRHGWVWLPLGVAPVELVLPEAYALPASVVYYEVPAPVIVAPTVYTVTCPHCGRQMTVRIQH